MKPILCLDFDGVIHSYTSGWKGAADVITDPPVPGAMEFIGKAAEHFHIAVFSSRSADAFGRRAMWNYIGVHLEGVFGANKGKAILDAIDFPTEKPPAFISIDDRCVTFEGLWPEIESLLKFKPWNKRPAKGEAAR